MKLSDTQTQILAAAAAHPLRLAIPPAKLPVAARDAVRKSLLAKGLIEAVTVDDAGEQEAWATEAGPATYRLVAQEPTAGDAAAVEAAEPAGDVPARRTPHRPTRRPQSPWSPSCRSGGPVACAMSQRPSSAPGRPAAMTPARWRPPSPRSRQH